MAFWLRVTIAFGVLAAGLVYAFGFDLRTGLELLLLILAFLPPVIRQSPRLYLLWSRIKYWILNRETI